MVNNERKFPLLKLPDLSFGLRRPEFLFGSFLYSTTKCLDLQPEKLYTIVLKNVTEFNTSNSLGHGAGLNCFFPCCCTNF